MPALRTIQRRLNSPVVAGVAIAAVGVTAFVLARALSGLGGAQLPAGVAPPKQKAAPFAPIPRHPVWPVVTNDSRLGQVSYTDIYGVTHGNWARQFGAPRSKDGRNHVGVDLYGDNGDPVVAIADGTVVGLQSFELGTWAILVEHDGFVALYGEVGPKSWKEFGVQEGSRVKRGDPIGRVGCMQGSGSNCTSNMVHFETYRPGTRKNMRWYSGKNPPPEIFDPTMLLLVAAPAGANT